MIESKDFLRAIVEKRNKNGNIETISMPRLLAMSA